MDFSFHWDMIIGRDCGAHEAELFESKFYQIFLELRYNAIRCLFKCELLPHRNVIMAYIFYSIKQIVLEKWKPFWANKRNRKFHEPLCLTRSLAECMKRVLTCLKGQTDSKHLTSSSNKADRKSDAKF